MQRSYAKFSLAASDTEKRWFVDSRWMCDGDFDRQQSSVEASAREPLECSKIQDDEKGSSGSRRGETVSVREQVTRWDGDRL